MSWEICGQEKCGQELCSKGYYTFPVSGLPDQVVKSDAASVSVPELEFEIPPATQRGTITTVEGLLREAGDALRTLQPQRAQHDPGTAAAIEEFLGEVLPWDLRPGGLTWCCHVTNLLEGLSEISCSITWPTRLSRIALLPTQLHMILSALASSDAMTADSRMRMLRSLRAPREIRVTAFVLSILLSCVVGKVLGTPFPFPWLGLA